MSDKDVLENGRTLKFVSDCYKNQQMCDKTLDNYSHTLEFLPDCYITQKRCDKAVNTHPSTINFFLNAIKLKKCIRKQLIDIFLVL